MKKVKKFIEQWITAWQRNCVHDQKHIRRQRVGPFHEVYWCGRCGAHAIEPVVRGTNAQGTVVDTARLFAPNASVPLAWNGNRDVKIDVKAEI